MAPWSPAAPFPREGVLLRYSRLVLAKFSSPNARATYEKNTAAPAPPAEPLQEHQRGIALLRHRHRDDLEMAVVTPEHLTELRLQSQSTRPDRGVGSRWRHEPIIRMCGDGAINRANAV